MSVGTRPLSLVEFLELPETEPASEYIDGRVVQKMSPKFQHSGLELELPSAVNAFARPRRLGLAVPELRCTFAGRSFVFDLAYFQTDRIAYGPDGQLLNDVFLAPDLAAEILSPGQSTRAVEARLRFAVKNGVRLGWLIDPQSRRAKVFRPGARPQTQSIGDSLDGNDVLPGFELPLKTVFGWLRRENIS